VASLPVPSMATEASTVTWEPWTWGQLDSALLPPALTGPCPLMEGRMVAGLPHSWDYRREPPSLVLLSSFGFSSQLEPTVPVVD
jgi:hypothetical protein